MFKAVETPVLTLNQFEMYCFRRVNMLCVGELGEYFDLESAQKISLKLSSRPSKESVAFECDLKRRRGEYRLADSKGQFFHVYMGALDWLKRHLNLKEKTTVHVTVYLHERWFY